MLLLLHSLPQLMLVAESEETAFVALVCKYYTVSQEEFWEISTFTCKPTINYLGCFNLQQPYFYSSWPAWYMPQVLSKSIHHTSFSYTFICYRYVSQPPFRQIVGCKMGCRTQHCVMKLG